MSEKYVDLLTENLYNTATNMSIDKIGGIKPIGNLDLYKVREIMTSNKINETKKRTGIIFSKLS